ncbi:hypothetical protein T4E_3429 [Trichinella pseudospiralis]|uniref:Uncharacterized protein n=1 Tax=Trichinella pseudospiralis TaxID=6337 RepID=A0A0V0XD47_TRIPS|nr:hypothetical protein T4E_3429 [Trichinella pseudospiralis]
MYLLRVTDCLIKSISVTLADIQGYSGKEEASSMLEIAVHGRTIAAESIMTVQAIVAPSGARFIRDI